MPKCGIQVVLCDYCVRFDTYGGCSHGCRYCFTRKKLDDKIGQEAEIERGEGVQSLLNFIKGQRTGEVAWVDWDIPIHWGGMSDPFQPCEREQRRSLECLKVFAETKYPFIISTKGRCVVEPEYLELLKNCNVCMQVSLVSPEYDKLEPGAPPFAERVEMIGKLSKVCTRVIVRIQPYMIEQLNNVMQITLPFVRDAGAFGVVVEAMKFFGSKPPGTIKLGGDFVYPKDVLFDHLSQIKTKAKSLGLGFYCGENRLRWLGDSLGCCGCDDMKGFKGNHYNLNHIYAGEEPEATEAQKKIGSSSGCFHSMLQAGWSSTVLSQLSFETVMREVAKSRFGHDIMGLDIEGRKRAFDLGI